MKRFLLAVFLVAGMAHFALATTTDELELVSGATTIIITDNGAGDLNSGSGTILYTNSNLNGWNISFAGGTSNSPSLTPFGLDISSLTASCTGGGCTTQALDIYYSDINFTQTAASFTTTYSATIATGSTSQKAWDTVGNTIFGTGTLIGTLGPYSSPSGAGSAIGGGPAGPSPYSLTLEDIISANSSGVSLDGNITTVPEPASLMMMGTGLIGLAGFARRKFLSK